jgi:hypothetical protein
MRRNMAERVGFEPTVAFRPLRFSRPFRASPSSRTHKYLLEINNQRGRQSMAHLSRCGHRRTPSGHYRVKVIQSGESQPLLLNRYGVKIVPPVRSNMTEAHPQAWRRFCSRIRKIVETVGSHLTERFAIDAIRVHDLWHFQHRLIRKVLSHTVMVFLNLQLKRDPLDLDGLVSA